LLTYILRRILYSIPVLLIGSFITFLGVRWAFDPLTKFRTGIRDPEVLNRVIAKLGLDKPLLVQYWKWLKGLLTGDFGISYRTSGDVWPMLRRSLGFTVQMIIWGILVALTIAILIGMLSAVRQYSFFDYLFTGLAYVGVAMPPFWFGLILIQFFGVFLKQKFNMDKPPFFFLGLHSTGKKGFNMDYIRHLILPVSTLAVQLVAQWSRFLRASMLDVLSSDFIRTARAKGVPRAKVISRHAFRNSLIPLSTDVATQSGVLFGGLVITESIFSIPGMGRLFIDSLQQGDVYAVLGYLMLTSVFVILFNLVADLVYGLLDPRVRLS
jgi:peptide/nickel transport system permease protein